MVRHFLINLTMRKKKLDIHQFAVSIYIDILLSIKYQDSRKISFLIKIDVPHHNILENDIQSQ